MDALAPSPLPSPLSDLTRDGVLLQEGGRRPPWRLLPLLRLVVCQVPREAHGLTVRDRSATRPVGSVPAARIGL